MTAISITPETLARDERMILRLKALIGTATNKTDFLTCLNRVPRSGPAWSAGMLTPIFSRLRARGYLTEALVCHPGVLHAMTLDAVSAPEGAGMVEAVLKSFPVEVRYWYSAESEVSVTRGMRLAVYRNDEAEFRQLLEQRGRYVRGDNSLFADAFAAADLGAEWVGSRLPIFRDAILGAKMDHWIVTGRMPPDFAELMDLARADPALRVAQWPTVADYYVLNGRLAELAAWMDEVPAECSADLPVVYRAVHALLSGEVERAVPLFTEGQRLYRKVSRKRKGPLPGYVGVLQLCALLALDDPARHSEIEALADIDPPTVGLLAVRALLDVARNRLSNAATLVDRNLQSLLASPTPPPFGTALLAVAAMLADPGVVDRHFGKLMALFDRIETPLAADMLAEVLAKGAKHPARFAAWLERPGRQVAFSFLGILSSKDPWERTLDSLEALFSPTQAAAPSADKPRRLVWRVDPLSLEIRPVEQTRQGKNWSAGRPVALKRLMEHDPALDYLDEFDHRAIRTIVRSVDNHYYENESFDCPPETTLPALVGHPRVVDARDRVTPVELVEHRAELVLSSTKGGFRLALSHAADRRSVYVDVDRPGLWRVVTVDPKAVAAAAILGPKGIVVPKAARDRLSALARVQMPDLPLRIEAPEIEDGAAVPGDATPVVRLSPHGDGLKVALVVRPLGADGPHVLPGQGGRMMLARGTRVRRDLDAEVTAARALAESCPSLGGEGQEWLFEDLGASLELLAELRALTPPPTVEWPEGEKLAVRGEATAKKLKATVKGSDDWFTLGGAVTIDENLVLDLKDLLARLERAQGRFVPLDDGGFLALDRHFRQQLERLRRLGDGLKLPALAGVAVRDVLEDAGALKADARWKDFVKRLDEAEGWQPVLPAGFEAELRDYQMAGFAWMSRLARWRAGALLADDMGLGKTVQTIAVMIGKAAEGPILVVAPTSVCGNWQAELARFAPGLRVGRLDESADREQALKALAPGDVLIASYGLLGREEERLAGIDWAMAVLDEAQAIKNAETQRAKASQRLRAGFRLALTGTPVENDLDELWSIFRFVNPGLLGSREAFTRRFVTPISRDNDANAKAALKALLRPFLLRRTKAAVLAELPARTEQTLLVEMGEEERAFYEALRRRALERLEETADQRTRIHILAEITKLRQACCHPALAAAEAGVPSAKLEAFLDLLAELREGRHRALVFSQFVGHLEKIRAALDQAGVVYQYLDGATPARDREKRVAAFQAGEGEVFLISLKAGGFGLNLTAADYVVHLDPWWNPAVEDQASDRAHRIGQQRPVTIYRLIVKDSIEEGILSLHRRKRDLADALLEGADASARLTEEDLLRLISGG